MFHLSVLWVLVCSFVCSWPLNKLPIAPSCFQGCAETCKFQIWSQKKQLLNTCLRVRKHKQLWILCWIILKAELHQWSTSADTFRVEYLSANDFLRFFPHPILVISLALEKTYVSSVDILLDSCIHLSFKYMDYMESCYRIRRWCQEEKSTSHMVFTWNWSYITIIIIGIIIENHFHCKSLSSTFNYFSCQFSRLWKDDKYLVLKGFTSYKMFPFKCGVRMQPL